MRLIWQGGGLAVLALACLLASGWYFYAEVDFGTRAVAVTARLDHQTTRRRMTGVSQQNRLPRATAQFSYTTPDGVPHRVSRRVSTAFLLQHSVGDRITLYVDPTNPRQPELQRDEYSTQGLLYGALGLAAAALAALSFGTAFAGLLARAKA
jgi:hypothetical protein